jgi:hypothetical protein
MSERNTSPVDTRVVAVLGRLQAACASDSNASLLAAHMSLSCAGRLRSASAAGVVIEIPNPPMSDVTLLGSTAAVSFPVGLQMAGFVARIIEIRLAPDGALMATLELPESLQIGDRRAAVRIAVPRETLTAAIVDGATRIAVRPIDVSLTGILIELDKRQLDVVKVGATVTLSLGLDSHEIVVDAEVCRRDGLRFGLRYVTEDGPPRGMSQVIYRLQATRHPRR